MWLIVDDQRELGCDVIVRTPEAAMKLLTVAGYLFEAICLDHDMGRSLDGQDVLRYGLESGTLPRHVQLVTSNPVGREAMQKDLKEAGYESKDGGTNWHKS